MDITRKNKFIVANKKDEHFEKDRELFLKVLPHHKLAQDLQSKTKVHKYNKHIYHGHILSALLDKVSEKEILENRSAETAPEAENENRFAELVKKFVSAGISVNEIIQQFISENPGDAEVEDFISEYLRLQKVNAIRAKFAAAGIEVNPEMEVLSFQLVDENATEEEVEAKIAELKPAEYDTTETDTKSTEDGNAAETESEQSETSEVEESESVTDTKTEETTTETTVTECADTVTDTETTAETTTPENAEAVIESKTEEDATGAGTTEPEKKSVKSKKSSQA